MLPVAQPNGQQAPLAANTNTYGGVGGPTASAPGGSPKNMRRQQGGAGGPQTFAGMQQQGMARPAPNMLMQGNNPALNTAIGTMQAQGAGAQTEFANAGNAVGAAQQTVDNAAAGRNLGTYTTSAAAQQLGAPLMQQVMALLQDPTQGLNEAAQSNFDRNNRTLGREFETLREGLNENMAARGLDASTIAATKLGELGSRQAEAQGDLAARIQEKLINDRASAMNNAINAAMGLRGQEIGIGKDEYTINRDTGELEWNRNFKEDRAAAEDMRFDKTFGLDREKFDWTKGVDLRDFDYKVGRDQSNDQFRDDEFDWRKSTDTRDFDYRQGRDAVGDDRWQQGFDRDGQWRTEDNTYRDGRDQVRDNQWERGFDRDNDWRADDIRYRDGRDAVGDERWNQTFTQGQNNFNTSGIIQMLQGMGFNNLPPALIDQIMQSLGVTGQQTGGGTPGGSSWAGGGGTSGGVTNF
jgi:hypothetical protein